MNDDERLDEIEKLARAATNGNWYAHREGDQIDEASVRSGFGRWLKVTKVPDQYKDHVAPAYADAQYFAAANPTTMLEIISLCRRLMKQREIAVDALKQYGRGKWSRLNHCNESHLDSSLESKTNQYPPHASEAAESALTNIEELDE